MTCRVFLAALILTVPLLASTDYTYTYTGDDFTSATGVFSTSDSVTGYFTLSAPLGDNLNGANIASETLSFSFTDGPDTITNSTPDINVCFCSPTIDIWTDASGNIINWEISLTVGELGSENITTEDYYAGIITGTVIQDSGFIDSSDQASNSGDAGSWLLSTSSAAPEPASLLLAGAGMTAIAASRFRSRRCGN